MRESTVNVAWNVSQGDGLKHTDGSCNYVEEVQKSLANSRVTFLRNVVGKTVALGYRKLRFRRRRPLLTTVRV
jgi:hypothetical protein